MIVNIRILCLSLFVIGILFAAGCKSPLATPPDPIQLSDGYVTRPIFIDAINPPENSRIAHEIYLLDRAEEYREETLIELSLLSSNRAEVGFASNVCVQIELDTLGGPNDDFTDWPILLERVSLIVDGEQIDEISAYDAEAILNRAFFDDGEYRYGGLTDICWTVELEAGVHDVVFQFARTNGEIEEYHWSFELF